MRISDWSSDVCSSDLVEDGFDQDEVGAAFGQCDDLIEIDLLQFVEIDLAIAGIVDVGRQRQRLVRRPDRARDKAAAAVARLIFVGGFAAEPRAFMRSAERRGAAECASTVRFRGDQDTKKKK